MYYICAPVVHKCKFNFFHSGRDHNNNFMSHNTSAYSIMHIPVTSMVTVAGALYTQGKTYLAI